MKTIEVDALALVRACQRRDAEQVRRILAEADLRRLAVQLAEWLPRATATQGLTWANLETQLIEEAMR